MSAVAGTPYEAHSSLWTPLSGDTISPGAPTQAQQFFPPDNVFNTPIADDPDIDPNSATWVANMFDEASIQWSYVAVKTTDGWPLYFAQSSDPVKTVSATKGSASIHLPQGVTPTGNNDGHLLIIEPDGVTETEMYQAVVSGTWPTQTVTAKTVSQFDVSTSGGSLYNGLNFSARGCAICCLAGLLLEGEFLAGVIPHALAMSGNFNGAGVRSPALTSDGQYPTGAPMGVRFQLDPTFDVTSLPEALQPIATCLQVYGAFTTDSGNVNGFQGQMTTDNNAAYLSLDAPAPSGSNSLIAELPWDQMRFLAA